MNFIDTLYVKIRSKEIVKAKSKLKKLTVNTITDSITKSCWKNNIQYDIILKNSEELLIRLEGRGKVWLLKYDKKAMIFYDEFDRFLNYMDIYKAENGIYITIGVFEPKIIKSCHHIFLNDVRLIDNVKFIKEQLGYCKKCEEVFKYGKLNFYSYLPN